MTPSPRRITWRSSVLSSAAFSAASTASRRTAAPSTCTVPSAASVRLTAFGGVELVCCAEGSSTFLPVFAITEEVTMKMISRTRKTSVSGVMLISATIAPSSSSPGRCTAMLALPGVAARLEIQQRLHEALARAREHGGDVADARLQPVEQPERDDRDEQTHRGGDQRLRDAARHDV